MELASAVKVFEVFVVKNFRSKEKWREKRVEEIERNK